MKYRSQQQKRMQPQPQLQKNSGYRWIDKDPIIDTLMDLCKQDGRSLSAIANAACLSPTTLHNWDAGKTKKPTNVSVDFTLRALGYERRVVKIDAKAKIIPVRWRR